MKVTLLLGSELLGKAVIVGALLYSTFKASTVAGAAMVAGYIVYNVAAHYIEKEKEKAGAELLTKLMSKYTEANENNGGHC